MVFSERVPVERSSSRVIVHLHHDLAGDLLSVRPNGVVLVCFQVVGKVLHSF